MTVKQQVLQILKNHRGKRMHQTQILTSINNNPSTVFRTLRKLAHDKKIKSDGMGYFWVALEDNKSKKLTDFV